MSDSFPIDDFLSSPQFGNDPGSRVYLYRLLRTMASGEASNLDNSAQTYNTARKLAQQLVVDTPEQLESLISDLGIGELNLTISDDSIAASLARARPLSDDSTGDGALTCEFERGLIDGSLELIAGIPVETMETSCCNKGDKYCVFEAVREEFKGFKRFVPGSLTAGYTNQPNAGGFSENNQNASGFKVRREFGPPLSHSWFLDLAARELARSRRHGRPLSFLYLDIDDLGQINTSHGRMAGDRLIYSVAAVLSKGCRAEDFLWYPGEDEFAMVLAETNLEEGEAVARRLIENIQTKMDKPEIKTGVTVSIGCSSFPDNAESVSDLYAAAKSALYQAKSQGKNCASAAAVDYKRGVEPASDSGSGHFGGNGAQRQRDDGAGQVGGNAEPFGGGEEKATLDDAEPVEEETFPATGAADSEIAIDTTPAPDIFAGTEKNKSGIIRDSEIPAGEQAATEQPAAEQPATELVEVVIASVRPLLLAGMSQIIADEEDMKVLGTIEEPTRLSASIMEIKPDLLISDLPSAAANDFEAIKLIRSENLSCKVAVLAAAIDQDVVKLAVEHAVEGVILQDSSPEEILSALHSVSSGETVHPDEVRAAVDELVDNKRMLGDLSEREQQVLKLMAEGKTNSQISEELYITVNTVRFHLANIYQKLGVSNRTEAANYYLRQGIAPESSPTDAPLTDSS